MKRIALPTTCLHSGKQARRASQQSAEFATVDHVTLLDHLEEDDDIDQRRQWFDRYAGNALCLLHGRDGGMHFIAPDGEYQDVVSLRLSGSATRHGLHGCALPAGQRILQLAACQGSWPCQIIARTMYGLHYVQLSSTGTEMSGTHLGMLASVACAHRPLHVCLHPRLRAEAACILDNGQVQLLHIERMSSKGGDTSLTSSPDLAMADAQRIELRESATGASLTDDDSWGCIEYAEHPRTLYVASSSGLYLADLRAPCVEIKRPLYDRRQLSSPDLRAGGLAVPWQNAQTEAGIDGMTFVGLSSCEQLLLFDIRALRVPLIQWRLPYPLPGPAVQEVAPGLSWRQQHSDHRPAPLPHYQLHMHAATHTMHVIDRTSGHAMSVSWEKQGGEIPSSTATNLVMPPPPRPPTSLDPDMSFCQKLQCDNLWHSGSAKPLPLSGSAVFIHTGNHGSLFASNDGDCNYLAGFDGEIGRAHV